MLVAGGLAVLVVRARKTGPARPGRRSGGRSPRAASSTRRGGGPGCASSPRYRLAPGAQHSFDRWFSLRYSYVIEAVAAFCEANRR